MKFDFAKLIEKLSQKGGKNIILAIGIVGIMLVAAGDFDFGTEKDNTGRERTTDEYRQQMEKEITLLLREIDGVGEVRVMITLESGEENVYVQQQKQSNDSDVKQNSNDLHQTSQSTFENEVVIISQQSGDKALVERTLQPVVQGVAVVCSGADDISVVSAVTNSVSVVLNVPTNRIYVTKMR